MPGKMTMAEQINTIADSMEKNGELLPRIGDGVNTPLEFYSKLSEKQDWLNEFVDAYIKIAYTVITSRIWENPLDYLVRSQPFGGAVEELFVNLAKPLAYDPWGRGEEQWERVMPDVRNMLHLVNVKFFAKKTVYDEGLRTAFNSEGQWDAFRNDLVASVTDTLNVSIYNAIKYLFALYVTETSAVNMGIANYETDPKDAAKKIQVVSNKMTYKTTQYNPAGVYNYCPKDRQMLVVTPEFDAAMNVELYAYMFGPDYAKMPKRVIMFDDFYTHDYDWLNNIFAGGVPKKFSDEEIAYLKGVPGAIIDRELFMVYKLFDRWDAPWNGQKLYWNYMHHWHGTMSYSPFACGVTLYVGNVKEPTRIINPYGKDKIKIGRDNMFNLMQAIATGTGASRILVDGVVSGDALTADPNYPGWYKASNKSGDTATITYTYTPADGDAITLTVNIEVI